MPAAQTVLISCSRLVDFAGAEITTIELVEAFLGFGWEVSVAAFEAGDSLRSDLDTLGAKYVELSNDSAFSGYTHFDLAWLHHSIAANRILADPLLSMGKVVFSSLSHFSPLECPPATEFELSRYLVHSKENYDHFVRNYPSLSRSVSIINNSVPVKYWRGVPTTNCTELRRLVIVSNHPPKEVTDVIGVLQSKGVHVDIFGVTGTQARVTPSLLQNYDAVLTIGKTTQYAIAAGIPVYCYDHFGGDGWLTPKNFQLGREFNFSGRGGRGRISTECLAIELCDGYAASLENIDSLYKLGLQHFVLEDNINAVLNELPAYTPPALTLTDSNIAIRQTGIFMDLRRQINYRDNLVCDLRNLLQKEQQNASEQILYRDALIKQLHDQIAAEKENGRSQIAYRDELLEELKAKNLSSVNRAFANIRRLIKMLLPR